MPRPVPRQLSFLSPIANAGPGEPDTCYDDDPYYIDNVRSLRKRRAKTLKPSDVPRTDGRPDTRALLRTSNAGISRLDRKQRLLRFVELSRGEGDDVPVYPREVVREALSWHAEQVLCVRSDPLGEHQPTAQDVTDARRVKHALELLDIPWVDYVIVGEVITSLVHRRVI